MKLYKYSLWLIVCWGGAMPTAHANDLEFDCLIEPTVVAEIGSPVQGILKTLLVDRSDMVKAGQPIALLNDDVEKVALEQAHARASMASEIAARKADLKLAKINLQRTDELHKQSLVPQKELDEARAREQVAQASLLQAKEKIQLQKLEKQRSETLLAQRTIHSPIDGVVVEQMSFPGEFIYDNGIVTVAQLDPLRVEVVLPSRLFGRYKAGDKAHIHPEVANGVALVAEVDVVDRLLDSRSGTFGMRLTLDNADLSILSGQKCRVDFSLSTADLK